MVMKVTTEAERKYSRRKAMVLSKAMADAEIATMLDQFNKLKPGESMLYHFGSLAKARSFNTEAGERADTVGQVFMDLAERGLALLVQRRHTIRKKRAGELHEEHEYEYLAIRSSK